MKNKNHVAFEGYLKQAVEERLRRTLSMNDFRQARIASNRMPAVNMQQRIEFIAQACRGRSFALI